MSHDINKLQKPRVDHANGTINRNKHEGKKWEFIFKKIRVQELPI
jgi:hypothetical protein